jgi:hypothetical protein
MKKILFLHGFFASGSCAPAQAIKEALAGKAEVLTPDLPLSPIEAWSFIHDLCDRGRPDLLVGNSCGSFYAQMLAPIVGVPALLGNPHFEMTKFLEERKGVQHYKSPRSDGRQELVIDDALIAQFAKMQRMQFDFTSPFYQDKVWGLFGEQDTLAHYEPTFLAHYHTAFHFPGGHTPTSEEVKTYYVPLIEQMLQTFERPASRYFRHFKGGLYRFERTAFDSETRERMVVYQALYGERAFWVRPERMFFEKVTRDGKTFNRFLEVEME